jgi:hypothetical protein
MHRAIETNYKGYRFRSRLEARWAVFFDELEIKWVYEPEGYALESGPYLPDFKVLDSDLNPIWVEIKPQYPTEKEFAKIWELCRETSTPGLILSGVPSEETAIYLDRFGEPDYHRKNCIKYLFRSSSKEPLPSIVRYAQRCAKSARFDKIEQRQSLQDTIDDFRKTYGGAKS